MSNQVTAIDFESQELIGKIHFKHPIFRLQLLGGRGYLVVSFLHRVLVYDVHTLR
jgi:hypothetical protein